MKLPTSRQIWADDGSVAGGALRGGGLYEDGPTVFRAMAASYRHIATKYNAAIVFSKVPLGGDGVDAVLIYTDSEDCILDCAKTIRTADTFFIVFPLIADPDSFQNPFSQFEKNIEVIGRKHRDTRIFGDILIYFATSDLHLAFLHDDVFEFINTYYHEHHLTREEERESIVTIRPPDTARAEPSEILDRWLTAKGIAEDKRPDFAARINRLVDSDARPQWLERRENKGLEHLNAPRFLRAIYPDAIDPNGRLVDEELVRLSDPNLVQAVQGYINQRIERELPLGDAEGLKFTKKDGRGRPKKRAKPKRKAAPKTMRPS
jgi:hypothetical protein